jgi:hypothetical protein
VLYGDPDRQVASIMTQNSASTLPSAPRIAVYITGLELDTNRLADQTFVGKMHIRERDVDPASSTYTHGQGRNYTVERLMPTPFKLTMKVDIWSTSTEQKLQILEQILVLFNPSLEIQTTDNYVDWTSLSVLNLTQTNWSSRSVPVGTDSPIDIASLTLTAPIFISPPVKVKHLGVITKIITSIYSHAETDNNTYIEGLGQPLTSPGTTFSDLLDRQVVTITDYQIQVFNNQALLMAPSENTIPQEPSLEPTVKLGPSINWDTVLNRYPGKYIAGSSTIYLLQPSGSYIVGTVAVNPTDNTVLQIAWDLTTLPSDTLIDSNGLMYPDPDYGAGTQYRSSPGNFDAIINPYNVYPGHGMTDIEAGDRFLIVEDIPSNGSAWDGFVALANDIIEYTGSEWHVVFASSQITDMIVYQTNIYTGIQYIWNGVTWSKSYEGEYKAGQWQLEL